LHLTLEGAVFINRTFPALLHIENALSILRPFSDFNDFLLDRTHIALDTELCSFSLSESAEVSRGDNSLGHQYRVLQVQGRASMKAALPTAHAVGSAAVGDLNKVGHHSLPLSGANLRFENFPGTFKILIPLFLSDLLDDFVEILFHMQA
jgi:hypothetical protein